MGKRRKIIQAGALAAVLLLCAGCSQEEMQKMNPFAMAAGTVMSAVGGNQSGGFTFLFSSDKIVHTEWMDIREDVMTGRSGLNGVAKISTGSVERFARVRIGDTVEEAEKILTGDGWLKQTRTMSVKPGTDGNPWGEPVEFRSYGIPTEKIARGVVFYKKGKVFFKFNVYPGGNEAAVYPNRGAYQKIKIGDDFRDVAKLFQSDGVPTCVGVFLGKSGKPEFESVITWYYKDPATNKLHGMRISFNEKGKVTQKEES